MFELRNWLQSFRVLTLGGIIGGAFGAVVYFCFSSHFGSAKSYVVVGVSAAVGTALQRGAKNLFKPVVEFFAGFFMFREQLFELGKLRKSGEISQQTYRAVVNQLVKRRFLKK